MYKAEIIEFNKGVHYELREISSDPSGLTINQHVLFDAVLHYFLDLNRYKAFNGFTPKDLANNVKVGAFTTYWIAAKSPIFDNNGTSWSSQANSKFALYAGLTLAEIDPHKASLLAESRPYTQCMQLLSNRVGTADGFVPIFELFRLSCPFRPQRTRGQGS